MKRICPGASRLPVIDVLILISIVYDLFIFLTGGFSLEVAGLGFSSHHLRMPLIITGILLLTRYCLNRGKKPFLLITGNGKCQIGGRVLKRTLWRIVHGAASTVSRSVVLKIILVFLCIYGVVLFRYSDKFGGNLTGFICLGDRFLPSGIITKDTLYLRNSFGYDGQYHFFMSHDPFITKGLHTYMDNSAYRYQRIMYAWLTAGFSFGIPALIPAMLVLVNVGAIAMGTGFVALMLRKQGMSPWYALFYAFLSGFLIAVLRDLCSPVAMGFMVAGFFFYARRQLLPCAAFLAAAILTRETVIAAVAVLIIDSAILKRSVRGVVSSLLSLVPWVIWQTYVFMRLDVAPWRGGQQNVGIPSVRIISYFKQLLVAPKSADSEKLYLVIFVTVCLVSLLFSIREILRTRNEISIAFLGFSMLPFVMTHRVWVEPWSYGRALLPAAVFLVLSFVRSKDRLYLVPLGIHAAMFVLLLVWQDII